MVEGISMRPSIFFASAVNLKIVPRFPVRWIFIGDSVKHFTHVSLFVGGSLTIGDAYAQSAVRQTDYSINRALYDNSLNIVLSI
jgi:hypothetical protein